MRFRLEINYKILALIFEILIYFYWKVQASERSLIKVLIPDKKEIIESLINLPNGYLACATNESFIRIWNLEEGILVRTLKSMTNSSIKTILTAKCVIGDG